MEKFNWIDADTILVSACMAAQHNYMLYKKDGEKIGPVKSRLQWTKDFPKLDPNKYVFRKEATLKPNDGVPIINMCKNIVMSAIRSIEVVYPDYNSMVCIEGEGNFRDDLYPNYKGNREGKIILRNELSQWVEQQYPNAVISRGIETDDTVAKWQWQGHLDFLEKGIYTHMASSCDKDARTVAGKLYNQCKGTELLISELEADRWFCTQMLYGDSVDNIKGINGPISKELSIQLGVVPNAKGMGLSRAKKIMEKATTSRECFEIVLRCYRNVHRDRFLDAIQEEAIALRMQHTDNERYIILNHMLQLKVDLYE